MIATSLGTGSGGQRVTFKLLGLREFAGVDDEVHYTTPQGASSADRNSYRFEDGSVYKANTNDWHGSGLVVRSLGSHLSAGASLGGYSSTQENVDVNVRVTPTVEYDFFRYAEFTRRRLLASYSMGVNRYRYSERTVYDKLEETLASQALSFSYAARAPWGNANVGASASHTLAPSTARARRR